MNRLIAYKLIKDLFSYFNYFYSVSYFGFLYCLVLISIDYSTIVFEFFLLIVIFFVSIDSSSTVVFNFKKLQYSIFT